MGLFISILEQSLLFLPLSLALFISYRVLRIPDLATDGSFVLGAALFAIFVAQGFSPFIAMGISAFGGSLVGLTTSLLQSRMRLNPLIAGILLVFILNTLVLKVMGRPNISLFGSASIFASYPMLLVLILIAVAVVCLCIGLLSSRVGLSLYAFGNNPTLLSLSGRNANRYRLLGLCISNGLVGFCGALNAQASGYADVGMGTGIVLIAIATVIMGKHLYSYFISKTSGKIPLEILFCFVGVLLYFTTVNLFISLGLDPIYLRLIIGLCLIGFLSMTKKPQLAIAA